MFKISLDPPQTLGGLKMPSSAWNQRLHAVILNQRTSDSFHSVWGGGAGRHEDIWTGFRRRPERLVLMRVLMESRGPEYRASLPGPPWNPSTAVLSSLAIPCPTPSVKPHLKLKYLSPLGLISHGSEFFLSSSKISWRKPISNSTSLI